MYKLELLLNEILIELRKLTTNLQQTQPAITLPERTPSERDDVRKSILMAMSPADKQSFTHTASTNQPTPPPLPSSVRMKWTADYEQLIIDCATSPHGTYRNSLKRLTDKLPEGTTISAIRNKCDRMR